MFPFLPSVKYPGFHSPAVQQEFEGCIFLSKSRDKSLQASLLLWTLKTEKKKISLFGTYFTSCKGWNRPSAETVKKPNPVTLSPSLQTHWSLKHFQISPTVGSYRPQWPRITQREIKLRRGFNTAGKNWMSVFPSVQCVIIAVVHRESKRWVPTCQNQAKGRQVPFCLSPSKLQVADALKECELFPPSEILLALCVLLLIEEFPSQLSAGDHFRHVHRQTACYASQNRLS